ncbi:hypothetical protein NP233_g10038 [Leucocoprinus birnbaumii]|uniref:F-box domain-containing protein n=1 Tax=Leucocoprinus birnbaumii TaxID=56174 RepID=A0AAD5VL23_9AGAR|nr:hypothetical protein NP233_g10038 [Leucocoprinus birnbaumii]
MIARQTYTAEQTQLDEDVVKLKKEIRQLYETRNELAPISILPPEVLGQVFVHLRKTYPLSFERFLNSQDWLRVTRVCRRWRKIAYNCPHLWAFIALEDTPESIRQAKIMLKRSKKAPLTVKGHLYGRNVPLLEEIMKDHFPRMKALDVYCDRHRMKDFHRSFLNHLSTPSLQLESLRLGLGREYVGGRDEQRPKATLPGDILSKAPHLYEVDLTAIGIQWASLSLCTRLCILKLDDVYPRPSFTQVLDVLKAAPLLQVISLAQCLPDQRVISESYPLVRLKHLESLSLEGQFHDCALLLTLIQHPSSTRLKCHFRAKGGAAIKLKHITEAMNNIANKIRDVSTQMQSTPPTTIQSARLSDSSGRGLDIYLFDQPLKLTDKPNVLQAYLKNAALVISFDSSFPWKSCAHAMKCLFTSFDLSHLYSLDINCGSYKLPEADIICATCGSLPLLEEIKIHEHLRGALNDSLLRSLPKITKKKNTNDSPSSAKVYFAALKTFIFENGQFSKRNSPETATNLEKILSFRHKRDVPIRRLVLNKNKHLRDWQLGEYLRYTSSVEVDGEAVDDSGLEWDTAEETDLSDSLAGYSDDNAECDYYSSEDF